MQDLYETPMLVDVEEACGEELDSLLCATGGTHAAAAAE